MQRVVIVGGGFAGLSAARGLARDRNIEITLIDERNYHLFQPLLYQVAMAVLSPAEIATPIRSLLSGNPRTSVLRERVVGVDLKERRVHSDKDSHEYDYLILACGVRHTYFGNDQWEPHAPGLKTVEQAVEIRRRVLDAFEEAETEHDAARQRALLTFVVVGGGPTGVELAGALGEISRHTLARDFRRIDPMQARVILIEAAPRILAGFAEQSSSHAMRDLESLGVEVWTESHVSQIDLNGVEVGNERIEAKTVLWAAGVRGPDLNQTLGIELDRQGRAVVNPDLSLPDHPEVFVAGDQSHLTGLDGNPLPGIAPVAMQQGHYLAKRVRKAIRGAPFPNFAYRDKGRMATIGRSRAVAEISSLRFAGRPAWWVWLLVHIYYLIGFKNRLVVILQWAGAFVRFSRGSRLIVDKEWQFYPMEKAGAPDQNARDTSDEQAKPSAPREAENPSRNS
jgi:NADH dehydrogenase